MGVRPDKPNVVQECYYTAVPASFRQELHEQLWAGLARGLGAIMVWDHVLVDRTDAWDEFLPLINFVRDLPLHKHAWQPLQARIVTATAAAPGPYPRASELRPYGDVPAWGVKAPNNRFTFDLTQSHKWMEGFSPTIWGTRPDRRAWRNPPIFEVDMPTDGTLLLEITEIGGGTNTLTISRRTNPKAEWSELRAVRFENGRRPTTTQERWLELPLSRGRQEIMLDNTGDWIRVNRAVATYPMDNAAAVVNAGGWTDGRHAFLYLQNQTHSRLLHEVLKQSPVSLTQIEMELPGLQDGSYRVEVCDTATGKPIRSTQGVSRDGKLTLQLPALERDAAIKVLPLQ